MWEADSIKGIKFQTSQLFFRETGLALQYTLISLRKAQTKGTLTANQIT